MSAQVSRCATQQHQAASLGACRLARDEEVERREDARLAARHQPVTRALQERRHPRAALGRDAQRFQRVDHGARDEAARHGGAECGERPAGGVQRLVPGDVRGQRQVHRLLHLEPGRHQRGAHLVRGPHVGQPVAQLDLRHDAVLLLVALAVQRRGAPLVAGERGPGLEHAEDLLVAAHRVGRVARGVNGVHRVVRGGREGHGHEVGLGEAAPLADAVARPPVVLGAARDLVVVVVHAHHAGAAEQRDLAHGPANTASHVQHLVPWLEAQAQRQEVLVALDAALVALPPQAVRKVEGRAPTILIEVGGQAVVLVHHVHVLGLAPLSVSTKRGVQLFVGIHFGIHFGMCNTFNYRNR
mmetsp:Transcript_27187/g.69211  ORF Transcript_27187/g.69211 Transcript_27187/m.69211 type:complete len:356 (-) Transcript_27187:108-1175(-)